MISRLLIALVAHLGALPWALAQGSVVVYPAPEGERLSSDYRVTVNGREVPVYFKADRDEPAHARDRQRFGKGGGDYSFAYFDFSGTAVVRVESPRLTGAVAVRPESLGIASRRAGMSAVELRLTRPAKISIEGDAPKDGLILIARPIETDPVTAGSPDVIHFGPGIHRPGVIHLRSNQTLHIAGGAIVKAAVVARGSNITLRGRGILDGSGFDWPRNPAGERGLVTLVECDGITVRDLIIRDSPCWTIVPLHSRRVLIEGVTICNSSNENDDGIDPCSSQLVQIRDCFIRTDDDCIAIKGWTPYRGRNVDVEAILVERCVLWADRARVFLLGHESKALNLRSITVRDCDVVHFALVPFLLEPADGMAMSSIIFSDIRVHGEGQRELIRLRPVELPEYGIPGFGHINGVQFRNLRVDGAPGAYQIQLQGVGPRNLVRAVTLRNVVINGNNLALNRTYIKANEHVRELRVER